MISLKTHFISGDGGYAHAPMTYTQIARNDKYAVYSRSRDGKVRDYEVFKITILKKGTKVFSKIVEEDTEQYPSTEKFGRTAWSLIDYDSAIDKFNELSDTNEDIDYGDDFTETESNENMNTDNINTEPKKRGRQTKNRPAIVFPNAQQFTMADMVTVNPDYNQPVLYLHIKKEIEANKIKKVGTVNSSSRGKKPVIYGFV